MEIMKLFKKALLASAIFGAVGVNAAVLSSDPVLLSSEGIAAGLSAENVIFDVDFVVGELTPSASTITLTFDKNVDLSDLETAAAAGSDSVINDPALGTGKVTSDGTAAGTPLVTFNYGTGSFTFDRFTVDADEGTIVFEVNLGNPLTAQSAFRMSFLLAAGVDFDGAASVAYSSVDASDNAIETGTGVLAKTQSQFSFSIAKEYDGRIERITQTDFSRNGDDANDSQVDEVTYVVTNNESGLEANLVVTNVKVDFEGDFDNGATVASGNLLAGTEFTASAGTPQLDLTGFDNVEVDLGGNTANKDGTKNTYKLTFTGAGKVIPQTGAIKATATISANAGTTAVTPFEIATNVDAGSWALDATVINIPYFPVGFDGLSTSVHFANESANAADVIVTAIDQKGEEYSGTIADLAGNTVTKVSQTTLMSALSAPKGSKLSVTFNIDANNGDVNAYAFSNAGTGRQALVTSQEKGIK